MSRFAHTHLRPYRKEWFSPHGADFFPTPANLDLLAQGCARLAQAIRQYDEELAGKPAAASATQRYINMSRQLNPAVEELHVPDVLRNKGTGNGA